MLRARQPDARDVRVGLCVQVSAGFPVAGCEAAQSRGPCWGGLLLILGTRRKVLLPGAFACLLAQWVLIAVAWADLPSTAGEGGAIPAPVGCPVGFSSLAWEPQPIARAYIPLW
jgi:hypothetical protein